MYTRNTLRQILATDLSSGAGMWLYQTEDLPEEIGAVNGYFEHAKDMGMQVNDVIIILRVVDSDESGAAWIKSICEILPNGRGNLSPLGTERT